MVAAKKKSDVILGWIDKRNVQNYSILDELPVSEQ